MSEAGGGELRREGSVSPVTDHQEGIQGVEALEIHASERLGEEEEGRTERKNAESARTQD